MVDMERSIFFIDNRKQQILSPHPIYPESLFVSIGSIMQEISLSWPFLMSTTFISQICVNARCNDYNRVVVFHPKGCGGFEDGIPDPDLLAFIIE